MSGTNYRRENGKPVPSSAPAITPALSPNKWASNIGPLKTTCTRLLCGLGCAILAITFTFGLLSCSQKKTSTAPARVTPAPIVRTCQEIVSGKLQQVPLCNCQPPTCPTGVKPKVLYWTAATGDVWSCTKEQKTPCALEMP